MSTHTKGPWEVCETPDMDGEWLVLGGKGQEFGLVGNCPRRDDAVLFAAAPDLLEATDYGRKMADEFAGLISKAEYELDNGSRGEACNALFDTMRNGSMALYRDIFRSALAKARAAG